VFDVREKKKQQWWNIKASEVPFAVDVITARKLRFYAVARVGSNMALVAFESEKSSLLSWFHHY
jgi:hypothetical protein